MADPNDFINQDETEGDEIGNPKAGEEGVGGLTTEEAEESYNQAKKQHFQDDIEQNKNKQDNQKQEEKSKEKEKKNPHALPQIGSIQDDEITVDD